MMIFEYQYDENSAKVRIELHPDASLPDAVEQFEAFLRAAGYSFDGHLELVEEEENVAA